jgi:hypothetical protein
MSPSNRRVFLMQVAAAGSVLAATRAHAEAAKVDEKEPTAIAFDFVSDTTKVNQKKYPNHTKDQKCANCALYQGKAADAAGPCPLFPAKVVPAGGWCKSWAKKP